MVFRLTSSLLLPPVWNESFPLLNLAQARRYRTADNHVKYFPQQSIGSGTKPIWTQPALLYQMGLRNQFAGLQDVLLQSNKVGGLTDSLRSRKDETIN